MKSLLDINWDIVEDLNKAAREASDSGHYLESAIIIFQRLEILLRIILFSSAVKKRFSDFVLKRVEDEKNFFQLVLYLDFVEPDNNLSERLLKLNDKRNSIMHRLFQSFESYDSVKNDLKEFCLEGLVLNNRLSKILDRKNVIRLVNTKKRTLKENISNEDRRNKG